VFLILTANFLSKLTWANHDAAEFSGYRDQLSLAIESLSLSLQVKLTALHETKVSGRASELSQMPPHHQSLLLFCFGKHNFYILCVFVQFEQGRQFDKVIAELGGVEIIQADPALLDQVTEKMENLDKLTMAFARRNAQKLDETEKVGANTNKLMRQLSITSEKRQGEIERMKMQNEVMMQQMEHMKILMSSQTMAMSKVRESMC